MTRAEFEQLASRVIASIPEDYRRHLNNLVFVVEDSPSEALLVEAGYPPGEELLGFYRGHPLSERYHDLIQTEPDMIFLFQDPIETEASETGLSVHRVIRETVLHEVAHYFGFSEEEMDRIEALWAGDDA